MEKAQKIQVLYLDHTGLVEDFVMANGGEDEKLEFCFIATKKEWEEQAKKIKNGLRYEVVILHYSFANLDGNQMVTDIRELLPRARLGIKTGIWVYIEQDVKRELIMILQKTKPDFCFSPDEGDLPFMFGEIRKRKVTNEEISFRGYMMNTPKGFFAREPEIRGERE